MRLQTFCLAFVAGLSIFYGVTRVLAEEPTPTPVPTTLTVLEQAPCDSFALSCPAFSFRGSVASIGQFSLTAHKPFDLPSRAVFTVKPGIYVVTQQATPIGYGLESIRCSGPGYIVEGPAVQVAIQTGDNIECVFTNTTGSLAGTATPTPTSTVTPTNTPAATGTPSPSATLAPPEVYVVCAGGVLVKMPAPCPTPTMPALTPTVALAPPNATGGLVVRPPNTGDFGCLAVPGECN